MHPFHQVLSLWGCVVSPANLSALMDGCGFQVGDYLTGGNEYFVTLDVEVNGQNRTVTSNKAKLVVTPAQTKLTLNSVTSFLVPMGGDKKRVMQTTGSLTSIPSGKPANGLISVYIDVTLVPNASWGSSEVPKHIPAGQHVVKVRFEGAKGYLPSGPAEAMVDFPPAW